MKQYIDKAEVVAEVERQRKIYMYDVDNRHSFGRIVECNDLLVFLDTLEVKEVDLEKEIQEAQRKYKTIEEYKGYPCTMYAGDIEWIAKHFFELGLKAQRE